MSRCLHGRSEESRRDNPCNPGFASCAVDPLPESYWEWERNHAAQTDATRSRMASLDVLTGRTFTAVRDRSVRQDIVAHIMIRSLQRQAQRLGIPGVRYADLHRGISGHDGLGLEDRPTREESLF